MRRKQKCGRTDGRTDGHGDSSIHPPPPNFVAGGIIKLYRCIKYRQNGIFKTAMATSHVSDKIADVSTKCRQMMYHVHNGSFKYGVNSSSNMHILIPMHIICLQKYSVQTKNRHIFKKKN